MQSFHLTTLLLLLSSFLFTVLSMPLDTRQISIDNPAQDAQTIQWCDSPNFKGHCVKVGFQDGLCFDIAGMIPTENDQASSFGPDPFISCLLFRDAQCMGQPSFFDIEFPGFADLRKVSFDKTLSSFQCFTANHRG